MMPTETMPARVIVGDALEVLRSLPDASVDSVVTDPPYGLTANKKGGSGVKSVNLDSPYGRARIGTGNGRGGFMGMKWDSDVPGVDVWAECFRVLKPGGHLLSFFGTRTYHRGVVNIEDAGFEIRDQIGWLFGQGFPKSHNLSGEWEGWGTALKPAWEPIVVARKPLVGTVAANVRRHGTGALNIDGCRVPTTEAAVARNDEPTADKRYTDEGGTDFAAKPGKRRGRPLRVSDRDTGNNTYGDGLHGSKAAGETDLGRWPANVAHDGSDEVLAAFPDAPGQSGTVTGDEPSSPFANVYGDMPNRAGSAIPRGDSGSAARFFYCAKASRDERDAGMDGPDKPLLWSAGTKNPGSFQSEGTKKSAKNNHPTVKPLALMRWLVRLVTPRGGIVLDPFAGSGTTLIAAVREGMKAIGIELNPDYAKLIEKRLAEPLGIGGLYDCGESPVAADLFGAQS